MKIYRVEVAVYGTETYDIAAESHEDAARQYREGWGHLVSRELQDREDHYVVVTDEDNNTHEIED